MKFIYLVIIFPIILFFNFIEANAAMIDFWNNQQKGADVFDDYPTKYSSLQAANKLGLTFIRMAPNKWLNGRNPKQIGNFLIGSVNNPELVPIKADVYELNRVLNLADQANVKVVITMLSLPYSRWAQHNNGVEQRDIWKNFQKQDKAIDFLVNLAKVIKNHKAVVGLNLRNEPSPERAAIKFNDWYTGDYLGWYNQIKGSPQDLNLFYSKAVKAIRKVAPDLVIVLDSGFYAQPFAFKILTPIADNKVIYSFHMYAPWPFPYNKLLNIKYPGKFKTGEDCCATDVMWNKAEIITFLQPVKDWQKNIILPVIGFW